MQLTGKNIVANKISGEGKSTFHAENPLTGNKIEPAFFEASKRETEEAIEKANMAFQEYRNKTGKEKADFLELIAEEILAAGNGLITRCMEETGLPEARLTGERSRTVNQLKLFAQLLREGSWVNARIDKADAGRKPLPKPDVRSLQKPLGPVGIFGASNFPLAFSVAGGDTASALAAGCTVVVKAHHAHPGTCELVGMAILKAIKRSGMPDGTFSMLHGQSNEAGLSIVRHPYIKAIGFTGSFKGGKALFDEANKRPIPIPVYAEMGSTNPVFILPGALKERREAIASDLAASVTLGVGQFCTNPGLVLLQESDDEKSFREQFSAKIEQTNSGVMLSSSIRQNYVHGTEKIKNTLGVDVLATGKEEGSGYRGVPSVFMANVNSFLNDNSLEEEIFGPSTLIITAKTRTELIDAAEKLGGHLTATIHGTENDLWEFADLVKILEQKAGRLILNAYPTGVEVCHSMVHGGPFPATTDSKTTSVGTGAIYRFTRPVCYQNFPDALLPEELKDSNPLSLQRLVNGTWQQR